MTLFLIINKQEKMIFQQSIAQFTYKTECFLLDRFADQAAYTVKINNQGAEYAFFEANDGMMDKAVNGVWRRASNLMNAYNHIALA